ncbi:SAM-dependent methyltransferase [Kibdelosporangium persicum]|uniref:O-Methyltransferase involved in polyketide biosynthesis n=1 Tax=Kibdelosporangium persicum TaxID=2698649 RepID=A0ABX2FDB9_9PSEU|nr:SAM-dependent methyltransferase [Kibdelosporangium persicum]NRN68866.1 O-Methyltransferase involved in polyketide biosynthesis [Kibdelosporangium persicum]
MATNLPEIDPTVPSIARVYDAFLGGKDHYEVDRQVYQQILQVAPESARTGQEARYWLIRAVRFLAGGAGIDQFLDLGSGLPTAENTHQAVQRINAEAQVVYVDNDPMVAAHGRALLEENDRTHFVVGDLRQPEELLQDPTVTRYLDWTRPMALIQCNTLHHVADKDDPAGVMAKYVDALPSGSYIAISHLYNPADGSTRAELAQEVQSRFKALMDTCVFRTREQIEAFFTGTEIVEPGLVHPWEWWPDGPLITPKVDGDYLLLTGVARKP